MGLTPAPEDGESMDGPRFFIEEQLGEGGFGKVYLGEDTRLDRKVAIKVLSREISELADSAGAAFDEAKALAGVEHRHVVPVYDAGKTVNGEVFVVSKFIEGYSLDEALTQGLLSRKDFLERMIEMCDALTAVHEAGLIHRDIKPDNILLDTEKKAVLIDFGIAATLDGAKWLRRAGTPRYMSPEQTRGQDHLVDGQSDLYSLGAVLYRGLIGDTLKVDTMANVTSEANVRQMEIRLDDLDEQLPPDLASICQKALAVPKSERYETAGEFARDLKIALASRREGPRERIEEEAVVPRGLRSFGPEDAGFFLKLVPGRREPSTKLPICIHQWKVRIEDRGESGDPPFRVGLLYGPSGSGKSSLLKAGLLPQLDESIIVIRFDASSGETEEHFKKVLCKRFPHLDQHESLGWMLGSLRRGGLPTGSKLLIVIDQFEQWLHAHPDTISTAVLTKSLRQCDGLRIQALITLRDEFWRPVSRLMAELDAPMRQGENIALVEPFDQVHGRRVLESLGRGLGRLEGELTRNQNAFLDSAIELASDGRKVSPLRLSLLAQIFRKRDWVPESLAGVKTTEDLGTVYLDLAFDSETGPMRGREESAKRLLSLLSPDKRSVIRGKEVSAGTLKEALNLDDDRFDELTHILDAELRLITPVAVEKGQYFQLSHDFLVRALRHWLAEDQKKTLRGMALLRLENQTEDWLAGDRKKLLPGFQEWIWFKVITPVADRSREAQQLMQAANRHFYRRLMIYGSGFFTLVAIIFVFVMQALARDSVDQLLAARPAELEVAVEGVDGLSWWTGDLLREEFSRSDDPKRKWRCALLLAQDGQEYQKSIAEGLLSASPEELEVIVPRLKPYTKETVDFFTRTIFEERHPERGIRAVCAMADSELEGSQWKQEEKRILQWLGSVENRMEWVPMMVPMVPHIETELRRLGREGGAPYATLLGLSRAADLERLLEVYLESRPGDSMIYSDLIVAHADGIERCSEIAGDLKLDHDKRARALAMLLINQGVPLEMAPEDLDLNAQLIYRSSGLSPAKLNEYLKESREHPVWQRVLMLVLQRKDKKLISSSVYQELKSHLDQQFRKNPDPGVHSSAELLLRTWGEDLPSVDSPENADWIVSPVNGMTFAIVEPSNRLNSGVRKYAIATSELTVEAYNLVFPSEDDRVDGEDYFSTTCRDGRRALEICNALSELEGFESCYEKISWEGMGVNGIRTFEGYTPREGYLKMNGYRLPTEDEWLWASIQDSEYQGGFGRTSQEVTPLFAWCAPQSREGKFQGDKSEGPGRNLYPNKLGLFDMEGNLEELTMNEFPYVGGEGEKEVGALKIQNDHTYYRGCYAWWKVEDIDVAKRGHRVQGAQDWDRGTIRLVRTLSEKE